MVPKGMGSREEEGLAEGLGLHSLNSFKDGLLEQSKLGSNLCLE